MFAIIVDELTRELRGEEIWELLFADDLAVINRKKRGFQKRIEETAEVSRERRTEGKCGKDRDSGWQKGWRGSAES